MKQIQFYLEVIQLLAPSLATAGAVAIGGSQVGTFVLLRHESMMALALPQVVAIGAAAALRWGWPSLAPALVTAGLSVILLAWSKRHAAGHWLLPSLYIAGLSISFLLIANSGAHVEELQNLFTGIDVSVSIGTATIAVPALLIAGLLSSLLWRRWLVMAQAPAAAELAGLHPARWDVLFLCLLATVLLFGTSSLGAVMILAMLFLPAATVMPWVRRVPSALVWSAVAACAFFIAGFIFSIEMDWPLSQSIGGVGFAVLVISHLLRTAFGR